ncbi:SDR family oxidoreductase [Photobacterium chitinilyticum]|uniref:dTDP-4-dehydrorhamnose reductase n=1 Tax=Photobacterium chitinilyticum TaxID=2485123 RepID=A0A3S3QNR6_9GAMM|nr:NAD(P)-dependent oxidoreductase [Photobacterium chitinilyticum]RWX54693.1 NAD(P)-dependent oxidoreductase [Photobacterium chitinilyticum]
MKKKVLLTGANGFFGTRFIKAYQHQFDIYATDVEQLDITDKEQVMATFAEVQPDYVIHAAAIAVTDFCNKHPDIARKVNIDGAVNVAEACRQYGSKLVFISTEQVFNGNKEPGPYSETDIPVPDTVYGQNKLEAEGKLRTILDELWIIRFTWLFGLPERQTSINPNVVWNTLQNLVSGTALVERTNEFRGLTYVHELIDQFDRIFDIPYDTYHVGAKNDLSRYDITRHILVELGQEARIEQLLEGVAAPATRDVRLDTSKLAMQGITFTDSPEAISHCLSEFGFKI